MREIKINEAAPENWQLAPARQEPAQNVVERAEQRLAEGLRRDIDRVKSTNSWRDRDSSRRVYR